MFTLATSGVDTLTLELDNEVPGCRFVREYNALQCVECGTICSFPIEGFTRIENFLCDRCK